MTEPILTYKKGEGWIYDGHESATREFGIWRITLINREPGPNEHFVHNTYDTPEGHLESIKGWWNWRSGTLDKTLMLPYTRFEVRKNRYPQDHFFTVTMELI